MKKKLDNNGKVDRKSDKDIVVEVLFLFFFKYIIEKYRELNEMYLLTISCVLVMNEYSTHACRMVHRDVKQYQLRA